MRNVTPLFRRRFLTINGLTAYFSALIVELISSPEPESDVKSQLFWEARKKPEV